MKTNRSFTEGNKGNKGSRPFLVALAIFCSSLVCSLIAADLTVGVSFKVNKFSELHQPSFSMSGLEVTMSGSVMSDVVVLISTNGTVIPLQSAHGTLGWVLVRNLDATNAISGGTDTNAPFLRVKATEAYPFRVASTVTNLQFTASTSNVWARFWVLDD